MGIIIYIYQKVILKYLCIIIRLYIEYILTFKNVPQKIIDRRINKPPNYIQQMENNVK